MNISEEYDDLAANREMISVIKSQAIDTPLRSTRNNRPLSSAVQPKSRRNSTLYDKLTILDWHNANGKNQTKTAEHFRNNGFPTMKQPLVFTWVKEEE